MRPYIYVLIWFRPPCIYSFDSLIWMPILLYGLCTMNSVAVPPWPLFLLPYFAHTHPCRSHKGAVVLVALTRMSLLLT